jgi:hypothetical protein
MKRNAFNLFAAALIVAVSISLLPARMQTARAISPDVVISQVYGGGGNASAPYQNDFIELFNLGSLIGLVGAIYQRDRNGQLRFSNQPDYTVVGFACARSIHANSRSARHEL